MHCLTTINQRFEGVNCSVHLVNNMFITCGTKYCNLGQPLNWPIIWKWEGKLCLASYSCIGYSRYCDIPTDDKSNIASCSLSEVMLMYSSMHTGIVLHFIVIVRSSYGYWWSLVSSCPHFWGHWPTLLHVAVSPLHFHPFLQQSAVSHWPVLL